MQKRAGSYYSTLKPLRLISTAFIWLFILFCLDFTYWMHIRCCTGGRNGCRARLDHPVIPLMLVDIPAGEQTRGECSAEERSRRDYGGLSPPPV